MKFNEEYVPNIFEKIYKAKVMENDQKLDELLEELYSSMLTVIQECNKLIEENTKLKEKEK